MKLISLDLLSFNNKKSLIYRKDEQKMLMASPMKSYAIKVLDENDKPVAELMTANPSEILVYIHRGFRVIDKTSGSELTEDMVNSSIGVSDGFIDVNG